ncbi:major facilitator superfamily domain-containing protein [Apiospora kogelbergensis]|uniref:major facilitator superfamily domain-containing protein n=1 Tax=Apiospora kogelbergensis TaxID=1337665 RepID=UPI0031319EA0
MLAEKTTLENPQETPLTTDESNLADGVRTQVDRQGQQRQQQQPRYPGQLQLSIITFALALGTLLIAIDNTIIGVAVPKITSVFNSIEDVGWYGSAYLLTITAFQPSFGRLYRVVNTKNTYIACIVIFEVGSIMCAAAPNSPVFILGRAVSGLGAAGLFQGALQVITLSVVLEKRPMYLGLVVSVFGLATCFGPVLGGFFTDHVTWRWCFWINVPVGAVALLLIVIFLKLQGTAVPTEKLTARYLWTELDPLGAVTIIASVCCLLLAFQWAGVTYAWKSSQIIGLFIGFGLLLAVFALIQWRLGEKATIPPRVLKKRSVMAGSFFLLFLQMTNFIDTYYIPFYFQAVQGVSAMQSGIQYIPLVVPQIVAVVIVGAIVTKTGHYYGYMIGGAVIYALGTGLLTRLRIDSPTVEWAAYLVVSGFGLGIGMQLPFTALQAVLRPNYSEEDVAVGNAVALFLSQLGGAIAVSAGQTVFINSLVKEVSQQTSGALAQQVIAVGATGLNLLNLDAITLTRVRQAYTTAVKNTVTLALVSICIAIPLAIAMERRNIVKTAEERKQQAERVVTPQPADC